jgi:hypothetical protein
MLGIVTVCTPSETAAVAQLIDLVDFHLFPAIVVTISPQSSALPPGSIPSHRRSAWRNARFGAI